MTDEARDAPRPPWHPHDMPTGWAVFEAAARDDDPETRCRQCGQATWFAWREGRCAAHTLRKESLPTHDWTPAKETIVVVRQDDKRPGLHRIGTKAAEDVLDVVSAALERNQGVGETPADMLRRLFAWAGEHETGTGTLAEENAALRKHIRSIDRSRANYAEAADAACARAEKAERALAETASKANLRAACAKCGAQAGVPCRSPYGVTYDEVIHAVRRPGACGCSTGVICAEHEKAPWAERQRGGASFIDAVSQLPCVYGRAREDGPCPAYEPATATARRGALTCPPCAARRLVADAETRSTET